MYRLVALVALAAATFAQPTGPMERLLPTGARIIESADISAAAAKPRTLVLWMFDPLRREWGDEPYCGTAVHGDHWEGPTRLSLVDAGNGRLINTVELRTNYTPDGDNEFPLPYSVGNTYYRVEQTGANGRGKPTLLWMRDLTGDGKPLEFALFLDEACGIVGTSALGYDPRSDRAIQFEIAGASALPRRGSTRCFP